MLKLSVKILVLAVAIGAVHSLVLDGPKAAAAARYVSPSPVCAGGETPDTWGNHGVGHNMGAMAAVQVRAMHKNGTLMNTSYRLNSGDSNGNPAKQIWDYSELGKGNAGRKTKVFNTGENVRGAAGLYHCNGFSQLAAGAPVPAGSNNWLVGNGWVVDCQDNGNQNTFWITDVDTPAGESGKWKLYKRGSNGWNIVDPNVNSGSNKLKQFQLNVENGGDVYLKLEWHPDEVRSEPDSALSCTNLMVENRGSFQRDGKTLANGRAPIDHDPRPTRFVVKIDGAEVTKVTWGGSNGKDNTKDVASGEGWETNGYGPDRDGSMSSTKKRWVYTARTQKIHVTATEQFFYPGTGVDDPQRGWYDIPPEYGTSANIDRDIWCYNPSCEIDGWSNDGKDEDFITPGDKVDVYVRIKNRATNDTARKFWNSYVEASTGERSRGVAPALDSGYPDNPDDTSAVVTVTLTAPDKAQNWKTTFTVKSESVAALTATTCEVSLPIYKPYLAAPKATADLVNMNTLADDDENPTRFNFTTSITAGGISDDGAKIPYTTCWYKTTVANPERGCPAGNNDYRTQETNPKVFKNGEAKYPDAMNNYILFNGTDIVPVAGETYCVYIEIASGGYVGPDGKVVQAFGLADDFKCATVKNKPYFKAYGKGIRTGGGFTGACNSSGLLAGWNNYSGGQNRGSGSELSALARIKITGVASAQANSTNDPTRITFANTGSGVEKTEGTDSPKLGGNYGGSFCFDDVKAPADAQAVEGSPTVNTAGSQKFASGQVVGDGSTKTISKGRQQSIFVTGNVYIKSNIQYSSYTKRSEIPSFVVRASGNIYIDPSVTRLDGLYIAGGKIYTCATSLTGEKPSVDDLYDACNKQLVVNGALMAKQINLMRTFGSLRNSVAGESGSSASRPCANGNNQKICAAEYINFSPEMYLANPALMPPNSGTGQYYSAVSLPPVL